MAERSISDQIQVVDDQNTWIVAVSYGAMFLYIVLALGRFPHPVATRALLGAQGIAIVALSVAASIGTHSAAGTHITMIVTEVVPFLILALGVDNMFIITKAFDDARAAMTARLAAGGTATAAGAADAESEAAALLDPFAAALGDALAEVGPTVTAAAVSEVLAFSVGVTTGIPALVQFCAVAALAVLYDLVLQLTWFVAAVVLDARRQAAGRADCVPCVRVRTTGSGWYRWLPSANPARLLWLAVDAAGTGGGGGGSSSDAAVALPPGAQTRPKVVPIEFVGGSGSGGGTDPLPSPQAESRAHAQLIQAHLSERLLVGGDGGSAAERDSSTAEGGGGGGADGDGSPTGAAAAFWRGVLRGGYVRRFMRAYYIPALSWRPLQAVVLGGYFAALGVSLYGATQLRLGLEQQLVLPQGSYLKDYFDDQGEQPRIKRERAEEAQRSVGGRRHPSRFARCSPQPHRAQRCNRDFVLSAPPPCSAPGRGGPAGVPCAAGRQLHAPGHDAHRGGHRQRAVVAVALHRAAVLVVGGRL
jgi:hypothetical protein